MAVTNLFNLVTFSRRQSRSRFATTENRVTADGLSYAAYTVGHICGICVRTKHDHTSRALFIDSAVYFTSTTKTPSNVKVGQASSGSGQMLIF